MRRRVVVLAVVAIVFVAGLVVLAEPKPKRHLPGDRDEPGSSDISCFDPAPGICLKVGAIGWCDRSALNRCCQQCEDKKEGLFCLKCRNS